MKTLLLFLALLAATTQSAWAMIEGNQLAGVNGVNGGQQVNGGGA